MARESSDSLDARIEAGAAAVGAELSARQRRLLLDYLDLLLRWNRVYNLTAVREPSAMVDQHLIDCLAAVPALRRQTRGGAARLLDVGSGAGLPGLVFAVAAPELEIVCVDAVGKKASFIRQAAAELQLRQVTALHGRIEALELAAFDVITSRAFSSLRDLVGATSRLVASGGVWMAMKGKLDHDEILAVAANVFHVEHLRVPAHGGDRCLVWMRETSRGV